MTCERSRQVIIEQIVDATDCQIRPMKGGSDSRVVSKFSLALKRRIHRIPRDLPDRSRGARLVARKDQGAGNRDDMSLGPGFVDDLGL